MMSSMFRALLKPLNDEELGKSFALVAAVANALHALYEKDLQFDLKELEEAVLSGSPLLHKALLWSNGM